MMLLYNLKEKMKSDTAAMGTVEQIALIALALFAVMAVTKFIMTPVSESAEGIGNEIKKMNPE